MTRAVPQLVLLLVLSTDVAACVTARAARLSDKEHSAFKLQCANAEEVVVGRSVELSKIEGIVVDPAASPLPAAHVLLGARTADIPLRVVVADGVGHFQIAGVGPGDYELQVCLDGFNMRLIPIRVKHGAQASELVIPLSVP